MEADLQRMDRFVQEIGSKMSTQENPFVNQVVVIVQTGKCLFSNGQEGQLLRLSDMDIQRLGS